MRFYKLASLFIALIISVFIFYISSKSFPPNPFSEFSYTSLIYHFGIFFLFSFFLILGVNNKPASRYFILVLAISIVYAALDELHQYFVPGRVNSMSDWGIDIAGSFFGSAISLFAEKLAVE